MTDYQTGMPAPPKRSEDDVYDRQIRLWGADAQQKMKDARVLYVHVTGVSSEILKNLVLAGVRAAICDGRPYPDAVATMPSSFLPPVKRAVNGAMKAGAGVEDDAIDANAVPAAKRARTATVASAMQERVHELNPLLDACEINEMVLEDVPDEYFANFDIIVASRIGLIQCRRISKVANDAGNKFILVDTFGLEGCTYLDFGAKHKFREEIGKDKLSDLKSSEPYVSFRDMLDVPLTDATARWDKVPPKIYTKHRSFLEYHAASGGRWPDEEHAAEYMKATKEWLAKCGDVVEEDYLGSDEQLGTLASLATAEISPVCAVLGGIIGNEVIKAISGKGTPANNMLMFDGMDGGCRSFVLQSKSN